MKAWRVLKVLLPQSNFRNVKPKLSNGPSDLPCSLRASLKLQITTYRLNKASTARSYLKPKINMVNLPDRLVLPSMETSVCCTVNMDMIWSRMQHLGEFSDKQKMTSTKFCTCEALNYAPRFPKVPIYPPLLVWGTLVKKNPNPSLTV